MRREFLLARGLRVYVNDDHEDFIDPLDQEKRNEIGFSWERVCNFLKITGTVPRDVICGLRTKLVAFGYLDLTDAYGGAYDRVMVEMIRPTDAEFRCYGCPHLVENENGNWICYKREMNIHEVDECFENQEWEEI